MSNLFVGRVGIMNVCSLYERIGFRKTYNLLAFSSLACVGKNVSDIWDFKLSNNILKKN